MNKENTIKMIKEKKEANPKNPALCFLKNFYEMFEGYSFENYHFKYFILYIYFFQTISYIYFFILKDVKSKTALYYCYFHYYLNLSSWIHGLNYVIVFFAFFFIYFGINILLLSCTIYNICWLKKPKKNDKKKHTSFLKIVNFLCDIYNRFILIPSIDIFFSIFQKSNKFFDEHPYFKSQTIENVDTLFKALGIIGFILSLIISLFFLYLNQDYKFLDKTKFRTNFSIMIYIVFILRIIQTLVFRIYSDLEWLHYTVTYFFLFISLSAYFTELPFRNSKISKFYISVHLYCLINVFLLSLYRLGILITEEDLFVNNLIISVICFKLGKTIYFKYYINYLVYEAKDLKVPIFTLEELINLYMNAKSREKLNLILFGYFRYHYKRCTNEKCSKHKEVFLKYDKLTPENKKYFIVDFVYFNFCDIISMTKTKKKMNNSKSQEIIYAKFLTFLIYYGVNPIKKFYEIQKVLYEKMSFSYYFTTITSILNKEAKKQIKMHLQKNKYDSTNTIIKNTYDEFFKASLIKETLEKNFKKLLNEKIIYFEKTIHGQQTLEELFFANLKFTPMIKNFKKKIENLNSRSSFCNILKYKFLSLLYSLILNNFSKAIISEKKLHDEFISKSHELIDKSYITHFFESDTVLCEASFLDYAGPILEKSKTSKFLSFFGYENNEAYKIKNVNDMVPDFMREKHEKFVENYLNQRRPAEKAQLQTFAVDKQSFTFPIYISFSLRHDYFEDFVVISAIRKVKDYEKKFCLIDCKGYVLNISKDFFYDLKQQYSFLEIGDVVFINIFQLIPELSQYLDDNNKEKLTTIKNKKSKLYFPDKMKEYIDLAKLKEREDREIKIFIEQKKNIKTKSNTKITDESMIMNSKKIENSNKLKYYKKDLIVRSTIKKTSSQNMDINFQDHFIKNMFNQENFKTAEIKFDLIVEGVRYGNEVDEKMLYCVLIIKKYKKPESIDYNNKVDSSPENIINSAIIDQSKINIIDELKVIHVMAMENNEKGCFGFKCKVHDLQGPQIHTIKKETNNHPGKIIFFLYI